MEQAGTKGPLRLDWDKLLPSGKEEEPPPDLVVSNTAAAPAAAPAPAPAAADRKQSPPLTDDGEGKQESNNISGKSDREIEAEISRQKNHLKFAPSLPDKGEKLRARLHLLEDERERRKLGRVNNDGCEELMQSKRRSSTSASDDHVEVESSSLQASQSEFSIYFDKKLGERPSASRTVNAFESELSWINRRGNRNARPNGQSLTRGRHKSALPARQSPFRCPTNLPVDADKCKISKNDQDGYLSAHSSHNYEEISQDSIKKKKVSGSLASNVVLVDDKDPEPIEWVEKEEKLDERLKDCKVYYPSRDDPESIEICFSDIQCLAPEAYISSTIMNFYICHLQEPTSAAERRSSDYHFFNTYFYNKLKEAVSIKNNKESSFLKLRRWWKGINIFRKAYILFPVHENLHWSLVIICIPDKEDDSGPIILHLDSLGLHFSTPIFENVKSFLREEWKCLNQGEAPPDLPISDRIWKNLPRRIDNKRIEVPQQRNEYDCGLFVLFFMERFIDEAPQRLKRKDLGMFGKKWFKPEEASNLRRKIKTLLVEEFRKERENERVSGQESSSAAASQGQAFQQMVDISKFLLL